MNSWSFMLIFVITFLHAVKAKEGKHGITARVETVMKDVATILKNPGVQQAAISQTTTKRMLDELIELAKMALANLLQTTNKITATGKCIRKVTGTFLNQLEAKKTKFLECELELTNSTKDKSKEWADDVYELSEHTVAKIQKGTMAFINCPSSSTLFKCAEETITELWGAAKLLAKTLPNDIIKPGMELANEIGMGLYKCNGDKLRTFIMIKKQLMGGVSTCWKKNMGLYNLKPFIPEKSPEIEAQPELPAKLSVKP